eukprot:CAMPEP_0173432384 /NCGR_PEP_ID=MMETSP1357-20121228/10201_1 /TAXON_ID=77926 /ORGANISM="Hemiselmis rufescens, Strain PCC563" /LENGTH=328 /DNA_ID=CAMNT_0014396969 /DNA_START=94 /DNA_END=1080 /DNA_ORIENTATION=-
MGVLSDPGLPNDAMVSGEQQVVWHNGTGEEAVFREVHFTASPPQAGLVYRVCFKAYEPTNQNNTDTFCVTISVAAPVPSFDLNLTAPNGAVMEVGVGCPVRLKLVVADAGGSGYCVDVRSGKFDGSMVVPPMGQLMHVSSTAAPMIGTHDGCAANEFELAWYPQKGQEPHDYEYCVHARDTLCDGLACEQRGVERCYHVRVVKCRYCLGTGETIMHAAARYHTDWLQLWGANTHIRNPDSVPSWSELVLGPTYTVQTGDTLQGISSRFGTTLGAILEANADIEVVDNQGLIVPGDKLCLLPYVCWDDSILSSAAGAHTPREAPPRVEF